jgi:capsular polysaccharide transport system permease protein
LPIDDPQLIEERTLGDFFTGLKIQTRVLHALIIRAMMSRYGRKNIGFLWLMLEPMLLCAGVIALRWLTQAHEERGVSLVSVVLSGYMPLTLWRHFTGKSTFIIRDSIGMLYHRQLTILDMFLMTMILEFMGCTLASIINYNALRVMGAIEPIQDYGYVIEGWCLMAILAMGVGSAIAVLVEKYEAGERFIGPLQYCLLPLCGCFYMVYWLPERWQNLALYIPMVHCFEIIRRGFFGETVPTHYTATYPLIFGMALLAIYLPQFEKTRDIVH